MSAPASTAALPSQGRGRPRADVRRIVDGNLWRLAAGAPWRDVPERFGSWRKVYSRFLRWQQAGIWNRALAALHAEAAAAGDLDWVPHFLDGTTVRAQQHVASAKKGAASKPWAVPEAAGPPRSTCAEGGGKPICVVLTPGHHHEAPQTPALLERGAIARSHGGRPRLRPERVGGDAGYIGQPVRTYLCRRGIGAVIPRWRTERRRGVRFDRAAYRERNRIERLINRLKQHRAIATRYEKLAVTYHALLTIACLRFWF